MIERKRKREKEKEKEREREREREEKEMCVCVCVSQSGVVRGVRRKGRDHTHFYFLIDDNNVDVASVSVGDRCRRSSVFVSLLMTKETNVSSACEGTGGIGILSVSVSKMELGCQGKRREDWEGKGKNGSFAFSFHDTPTHRRCSCLSSYLSCFYLFFVPCTVSLTMMMMTMVMKERQMMSLLALMSVKRGVMNDGMKRSAAREAD